MPAALCLASERPPPGDFTPRPTPFLHRSVFSVAFTLSPAAPADEPAGLPAAEPDTAPPGAARRALLRRAHWHLALIPLILFLAFLTLRNAWITDDAFITLRTIGNWLSGDGLVYNVGERVQGYTHVLWMFLLAAVIRCTGDYFYTTIALGWLLTLASALLLAFRISRTPALAAFGVAALLMSKAFIDFSTSGLENPLSHLLLLWFAIELLSPSPARNRVPRAALAAALAMLNRIDAAALVGPPLLWLLWQRRGDFAWTRVVLAFLPLILWELFSCFYYGSPFPNTAYAKAFSGMPHTWLWAQGFFYFVNSLRLDPLTLPLTASGIAVGLSRRGAPRALAIGVLCGLLYVLHVGGDFMTGRFLTPPFILALALLLSTRWRPAPLAVFCGASILAGAPTLLRLVDDHSIIPSFSFDHLDDHRIADERLFYVGRTGIDQVAPDLLYYFSPPPDVRPAPNVSIAGAVGIEPFRQGPTTHIIDHFGLVDPLIARLPARVGPMWRIGHLERRVPEGYLETVKTGESRFADPRIALLYDRIALVTRGDLWSLDRLREALLLNLGRYDYLIDREYYASPYYDHLEHTPRDEEPPTRPWNYFLNALVDREHGLTVELDPAPHAAQLGISLDGHHAWHVTVRSKGVVTARAFIPARGDPFATRWIALPPVSWKHPVDEVHLMPVGEHTLPVFGQLTVRFPHLLLLSPAPRETWRPGEQRSIRWFSRESTVLSEARLEFWRDGRRIAEAGPLWRNKSVFSAQVSEIAVPDLPPGEYLLRIFSVEGDFEDFADDPVTIATP